MRFEEYRRLDAVALAQLVRKGEVVPRELLELAVARAEAVQPRLNIVSVWDLDLAERLLERARPQAPFWGVPFLVKDLHGFIEGTRCTNGSRLLASFQASHTSTFLARVVEAGWIPFAKTLTPEFGLNVVTEPVLHGPCRNPWNPSYSPGGSSGGAAAAVAAGVVPLAHATDGGGSIRIPASHTALLGLKPSRARTPAGPAVAEGWSGLSTGLAVARSLRDLAAFLDGVHGPESGAFYACPAPSGPFRAALARQLPRQRIALMLEPPADVPVAESVRNAVLAIARLLERMGHEVEPAAPALDGERFAEAFFTVVTVNAARDIMRFAEAVGRPPGEEVLERATLMMVEKGRATDAVTFLEALHTVQATARAMGELFERYQLLLSPVCAEPPPEIGWIDQNGAEVRAYLERTRPYVAFTSLHNASGCPSLSFPAGRDERGLPIGAMLTAPFGQEEQLFQIAAELDLELCFGDRQPPEVGS